MRFSLATAFCPPEEWAPLATAADDAGYHALAMSDHVVNLEELRTPYPYTDDGSRRWSMFTPWLDPWVAVGALSAVTTRLRFFTNVYVLPMRNVFHVAKTVASAAVLSGNRVDFGIGMGWCEDEFELLDQPFARRGKRADEMLEALRLLWSGELVEFHGEQVDFPRLEMNPPVTQPIPVLVGGMSERALRRAARHDGWISDLMTTPQAAEARRDLDRYREEYGRADLPFSMVVSLSDTFEPEQFAAAAEVGVTDLLTMPWFYYHGFTDELERKIDGIYRFADEVMSQVDS